MVRTLTLSLPFLGVMFLKRTRKTYIHKRFFAGSVGYTFQLYRKLHRCKNLRNHIQIEINIVKKVMRVLKNKKYQKKVTTSFQQIVTSYGLQRAAREQMIFFVFQNSIVNHAGEWIFQAIVYNFT